MNTTGTLPDSFAFATWSSSLVAIGRSWHGDRAGARGTVDLAPRAAAAPRRYLRRMSDDVAFPELTNDQLAVVDALGARRP